MPNGTHKHRIGDGHNTSGRLRFVRRAYRARQCEHRPDGTEVAYTLCFPKSFTASLKGCRVNVRGTEYRVIGDPQRYDPENTPGDWNLTVEVGRTDG